MRHNTQELIQPYILSISDKNHTLKIKAATLRVSSYFKSNLFKQKTGNNFTWGGRNLIFSIYFFLQLFVYICVCTNRCHSTCVLRKPSTIQVLRIEPRSAGLVASTFNFLSHLMSPIYSSYTSCLRFIHVCAAFPPRTTPLVTSPSLLHLYLFTVWFYHD